MQSRISGLTLLSAAISLVLSGPVLSEISRAGHEVEHPENAAFRRIATFPAYLNTDINTKSVAEIVAVSKDGNTLVYTDSASENIGFVDITDPSHPAAAGVIAAGGEPTSVAVVGGYALAAVNTSTNFVATSGVLKVIDIASRNVVATLDMGGQPDAVAISPDGRYAAVVIENERDEDLGNGEPPQAPAGYLVIVDMVGEPTDWTARQVNLSGLADLFPEDPETEFVAINENNIALVTLQENNYLMLVDLASGTVIDHFSAGKVDLDAIDIKKNSLIELTGSLRDVPREPDGAVWISPTQFVTADEGDLYGGSRGFTLFNIDGSVAYNTGNSVEHAVVRHGHFPEKRAGKKGNETENVAYGVFQGQRYLFAGSERASVVLVYRLPTHGNAKPQLVQILPSIMKPEGLLAIPGRNLFVSAGEKDDRGDKIRAGLSIYQYGKTASYPDLVSVQRHGRAPIAWGALSGLALDPEHEHIGYSIQDSFYDKSRIFVLNLEHKPARITREIILHDSLGQLAAVEPSLVNSDGTVNLDPEGIAVPAEGGFWLASEGKGSVGSTKKPFKSRNLLLRVNHKGDIMGVVTLPATVNARQQRFGLEGVASVGRGADEKVYVAFQREWSNDPDGLVRIGRYDTATGEWAFYHYPLDAPLSANGGWVGLSEIAYLGNDEFAVIERDNQGGPDAVIKRIYRFSVAGVTPQVDTGSDVSSFPLLGKTLAHDLVPDLKATGGLVLEKVEGMAVSREGDTWVVTDNDGVDDSNGETRLIRLEELFEDQD